jgi:GT2 family glycosyltransferase
MSTAVLIVNYRSYDALSRCIASLLPHLDPQDDVVIVDHESDPDALSRATRQCSRAIALPQPDNRGFAAGINLAASRAQAPYLLLLNPDTIVDEPIVRVLAGWMAAHPDVGVAGAKVLNVDGTVQRSARRFPGPTTLIGGRSTWLTRAYPGNWFSRRNLIEADVPVDVDWVSGACLMTRRDVFESLGGFDESFFMYWEDADYCRRVSRAGYRCVYAPVASVRHVGGVSAASDRARMVRAFHDSAFYLYRKHGGRAGQLAAPVVRLILNARAWRRLRALRLTAGRAVTDEKQSASGGR